MVPSLMLSKGRPANRTPTDQTEKHATRAEQASKRKSLNGKRSTRKRSMVMRAMTRADTSLDTRDRNPPPCSLHCLSTCCLPTGRCTGTTGQPRRSQPGTHPSESRPHTSEPQTRQALLPLLQEHAVDEAAGVAHQPQSGEDRQENTICDRPQQSITRRQFVRCRCFLALLQRSTVVWLAESMACHRGHDGM